MRKMTVPFDVKAVSDREIEGYGSVFGNVDLGDDVVVSGAFSKSLAEHKKNGTRPKMLWNHRQSDLPIGVWTEFSEDASGLWMKGELADTQMGNDVRTLAKMRAIDTMSIGYIEMDSEFDKGIRFIKEADLWEVSPVNFAMNPQAVIAGVKSLFSTPKDLEKHLRDLGCSKNAAREVVHDLMGTGERPEADRCEAEDEEALEAAKKLNDELTAALIRSQLKRL